VCHKLKFNVTPIIYRQLFGGSEWLSKDRPSGGRCLRSILAHSLPRAFGRIQIPVHRVNPLPWVIPALLTVGTGIKSTSTTLNIRPPERVIIVGPHPLAGISISTLPIHAYPLGPSGPVCHIHCITEVTPATDRYDPSRVASSLNWNLAMIIHVAKLLNGSGKHVN